VDVLVVAPDIGLPWAANEARHIVNTLGAKIVSGKVTIADIMDKVDAGNFDVLWFATHGNESGISLSDDMLPADVLAQMARRCGAKLVFLNACSSERVANAIYAAVQVPVICAIAETMDHLAYFTAHAFANDIAKLSDPEVADFRKAFQRSRTQNFRMVPEMGNERGTLDAATVEQVYRNRNRLWELSTKIDNIIGIVNEMRREEQERIEERKEDRRSLNTLKMAVGFLIFLVIIVLILNIFNFYTMQSIVAGAL
jgi:alkanesulfonate monooxygenase SsuD/methylene tetrahydromethanopterin reductase-like flavin-dependent oxidoreductase (luciferase family)